MFATIRTAAALTGVAVTLACVSASPAQAGKREMQILQTDVDELQRRVYEMKQHLERQTAAIDKLLAALGGSSDMRAQLASFNANIDGLRRDIRLLGERFDATEGRLRRLEDKVVSAIAYPVAPPVAEPPEETQPASAATHPVPGAYFVSDPGSRSATAPQMSDVSETRALYNQAYADYLQEKFDLAIAAFREYIAARPGDDLNDNAQYWIGMSYFNQRLWSQALSELDTLLDRYPRADNRAEAMYRKGIALRELRRFGQSVLVLNDVIAEYPDSEAARQAQARLKEMADGP